MKTEIIAPQHVIGAEVTILTFPRLDLAQAYLSHWGFTRDVGDKEDPRFVATYYNPAGVTIFRAIAKIGSRFAVIDPISFGHVFDLAAQDLDLG